MKRLFFNGRKGFTLIEIMLVVTILAMLMVLGFPNFIRARLNANETAAVHTVRSLSTALESYRSTQSPTTYPALLSDLSSANPSYIDAAWTNGQKQGYQFTYTWVGANQFTLIAAPLTTNLTGNRTFFMDESGVIRVGTDNTGIPIE